MKYLLVLALSVALVIGCSSPTEPTTPKILSIWAHSVHNLDGSHTVTAYMDIEGDGTYWLALDINGYDFAPPFPPPIWQSDKEVRMSRIFEINTTIGTCKDTFTVTGHHGGGDGASESINGILP